PNAWEKRLRLSVNVAAKLPRAAADPRLLRRVLLKLTGNAIKFTDRGEVVVQVSLDERSGGEVLLHFRVSDTGIGIPNEKQQAVFDAFAQADASMTRRYGGTGLGLTISARLVALMGGRIWVESEERHGSNFHFTVRLRLATHAAVNPTHADEEILRGLRVLVVDDNATNRRILDAMLTRWNAKPVLAGDAVTALRLLSEARSAREPFNLVLTDAHMPDIDGFTFAARVQQDAGLAGAIVMLTSGGLRGDAVRCRRLGIAAYLTKPVAQSELRDAILKVLGRSALARGVPPVTRHSLRETRSAVDEKQEPGGLKILLVEDNGVNQALATRLLEKMGNQVALAQNGLEALAAIEKQPFDLVLMDVQMPEMNGLEATSILRARERDQGRHTPVIAMTAYAMKGDRERCIDAGMDGYVSKPIVRCELTEAMRAVVPSVRERQNPERGSKPGMDPPASVPDVARAEPHNPRSRLAEETSAPFDYARALDQVDGDRELLAEVAALFLEEYPKRLVALRRAIEKADGRAMSGIAHSLKGEASSFAADGVCRSAIEIETAVENGDFDAAKAACSRLKDVLERLKPDLEKLSRLGAPELP
ncbi:MAG: response regulator, partial [Terriglobia bacterium]